MEIAAARTASITNITTESGAKFLIDTNTAVSAAFPVNPGAKIGATRFPHRKAPKYTIKPPTNNHSIVTRNKVFFSLIPNVAIRTCGQQKTVKPAKANPSPKAGEITQPGVPGEICGRGPHVMLMYYKDPEKTEKAFACGWFHSGDIGIMNEKRFIEVVDRKKDMIKTGGENVSSREVEEVIYKHPDVWEVAVVGLPHEKWIEAVTAIVTPKPGRKINPEEIIELCRKELSPFKVPKAVIILDPEKLPKTPSGKIMKRELRKMFSDYYR
ncbi:MAG: AMP-binding enzyme [Candidatus Bathyarchaeota archaeon]